ncbi:ATP-binding cassette domain-containing protein [Marinivivus vitaminiproducens]|uniref:ATP-binding cassette domain-containing protein n=1 Tax=Marinivivus vitaminiproducens TaxID=3035935 RepID=UPI00279C2828|nr:ABC transporter ATP-binding protein [Geminicoccaceae bacterium SCSIO 64248]
MTEAPHTGLALDGVTVGFAPERIAVADTSFTLAPGERALVCGAAASGKSTLLAAAAGVVPRFVSTQRFAGTVALGGVDHGTRTSHDLFQAIGCVFQNLDDQLWDLSVEDVIAFPLENRGVAPADIRTRLGRLIGGLELERLLGRRVLTLSGGERRMVALAAALASSPDLLVLDEPTTGLDPAARVRLVNALDAAMSDGRMLLAAEQDMRALQGSVDRVLLQREGRITADLAIAEAKANHASWKAAGLIPPVAPTIRRARSRPGPVVLDAAGLVTALRRSNGTPVLQGVDLALRGGEITGLIGVNGAGKTTLFRALLGLAALAQGRVVVAGEDATAWTPAKRARRIGYLPQDVRRLLFNLTLRDEVAFAVTGDPRRLGEPVTVAVAEGALGDAGLADRAEASPFALSAREQAVLGLVCLNVTRSPVVILDEPLIARDLAGRAMLDRFLDQARSEGRAVLLASHDLDLVDAVADRLLILNRGRIAGNDDVQGGWRSPAFAALGWPAPELPALEAVP